MATFAPHVTKRTVYVDVAHKTSLSAQEAFACLVLFVDNTEEGAGLRNTDVLNWPPLNQAMLRHVCKVVLFQLGHRRVALLATALTKYRNKPPAEVPHAVRSALVSLDDTTAGRLSEIRQWAGQALVFES